MRVDGAMGLGFLTVVYMVLEGLLGAWCYQVLWLLITALRCWESCAGVLELTVFARHKTAECNLG